MVGAVEARGVTYECRSRGEVTMKPSESPRVLPPTLPVGTGGEPRVNASFSSIFVLNKRRRPLNCFAPKLAVFLRFSAESRPKLT